MFHLFQVMIGLCRNRQPIDTVGLFPVFPLFLLSRMMDERDVIQSITYVFARVTRKTWNSGNTGNNPFLSAPCLFPVYSSSVGTVGARYRQDKRGAFPGTVPGPPSRLQDAHNPVLVTLRPIARLFPEMSEYLRDRHFVAACKEAHNSVRPRVLQVPVGLFNFGLATDGWIVDPPNFAIPIPLNGLRPKAEYGCDVRHRCRLIHIEQAKTVVHRSHPSGSRYR